MRDQRLVKVLVWLIVVAMVLTVGVSLIGAIIS